MEFWFLGRYAQVFCRRQTFNRWTTVKEESPTLTFNSNELRVRGASGNRVYSYVKFVVSDAVKPFKSAKIKLYAMTDMTDCKVHYCSNNNWSETTINWNNKPATGPLYSAISNIVANKWYEFDVSGVFVGNGTYTFRLSTSDSRTARYWRSNNNTDKWPWIVFETNY